MTAVVQVDVPALYAALDRARQQHGLSWRQLATKLGVSPSTFTRMSTGGKPDADMLVTFATWLRMPLAAFVVGEFPEAGEVTELRARVDELERGYTRTRQEWSDALRELSVASAEYLLERSQREGWERAAHEYQRQLGIARQQLVDNGIEPDRRIM